MTDQITEACEQFIKSLGTEVTNDRVFEILAGCAEKYELVLRAEQMGIRGVKVFFTPSEKSEL